MLKRTNLPQMAENAIMRQIVAGVYKEGDRLPPEHELAESLGVSRGIVREALNRLQRSGLIRTVRGSMGGSFVQKLDISVVTDALSLLLRTNGISFETLMEARRALSPSLAAMAAERASDTDLAELERLCAKAEEQGVEGNAQMEAILGFHLLLARMTGNAVLEAVAQPLTEIAGVFIQRFGKLDFRERMPAVIAMHREVVQALAAHDADQARECMTRLMQEAAVGLHRAPA